MTLAELAQRLGSPPRQIRYLIAEGILPPSGETGRGADGYGDNHVWLGEKFKEMNDIGFSVKAIKLMLDNGIISINRDGGLPIYQSAAVEVRIRDIKPLANMNDAQAAKTVLDIAAAIEKARKTAA